MNDLDALEKVCEPQRFWEIHPALARAKVARPPSKQVTAAPAPMPVASVRKPVSGPLGEISDWDGLIVALRARQETLNISHEQLSALAGLPDRYSSKVLSTTGRRRIGANSFGPLLGALGLKLIAVEDLAAIKRNRYRFVARDKAHVTSAKKFHARPEMQAAADARQAHRNALLAIKTAEVSMVKAARLKAARLRDKLNQSRTCRAPRSRNAEARK